MTWDFFLSEFGIWLFCMAALLAIAALFGILDDAFMRRWRNRNL